MNGRTIRWFAGTTLVGAIGLWTVPSEAFRMIQNDTVGRVIAGFAVPCDAPGGFAHWALGNRNLDWFLNSANQGLGKGGPASSAMNSWNNVFRSNYRLRLAGNTAAGFVTDGQNTLRWATGEGCEGLCLGLTALVLQAGQQIVETDITMNNAVTWRTNGRDTDTEAVLAHEFGHSLGIHHSEVGGNPTMQATYFGREGRTLENDDRAALECSETRYGDPAPVPVPVANPQEAVGPVLVNLTGTASFDTPAGTIVSYLWQLPDGSQATTANTQFFFPGDPSFTRRVPITLTVTDNAGFSRTGAVMVTVYCSAPPWVFCPTI